MAQTRVCASTGRVRNALEMLRMTHGSVDLSGLVDFVPDLDNVKEHLTNWLSDNEPLSNWAGVTTDTWGNVIQIDIALLDPVMEVRHRLPNLRSLDLSGIANVRRAYLRTVGVDYRYGSLAEVNLSGIAAVDDSIIKLWAFPCLEKIDLTACAVQDRGLAFLMERCPRLKPENVLPFSAKGDEFAVAVAKKFPSMSQLDLRSGCVSMESEHDYKPNQDQGRRLSIPGARQMIIVFDSKIEFLESNN